jgi:hypothetical protein
MTDPTNNPQPMRPFDIRAKIDDLLDGLALDELVAILEFLEYMASISCSFKSTKEPQ